MEIYQAEKEANLTDVLKSDGTIAFSSLFSPVDPYVFDLNTAIIEAEQKFGMNRDTFDLFPVQTIYVTVGWNKNDDIFDKMETWKGRHSVAHKPFNLQHTPSEIIGHITEGLALSSGNYSIIPDNTQEKDLPQTFHLLTKAVIYKHLKRGKELEEKTQELIKEIIRGEWYVSMECLFDSFDYGLMSSDGSHGVYERKEDTAFLTKHLRCYGGSGEYDGKKLGRVLRNITFVGKGLVKRPANLNSVFLFDANIGTANEKMVSIFNGELMDDYNKLIILSNSEKESEIMSDNLINEYKEQLESLRTELADTHKRLRELDEQTVNAKLDAKSAEISERDKTIEDLQKQLKDMTDSYNQAEKDKAEVQDAIKKTEKELADASKKLEDMEAMANRVKRVSDLVGEGVDKSEAESIVDKFVDIDDEKFTEIVAMQKKLVELNRSDKVEKGSNNDSDNAGASEQDSDQVIDDLHEEEEPDLTSAEENEEDENENRVKERNASIAEYIVNYCKDQSEDKDK